MGNGVWTVGVEEQRDEVHVQFEGDDASLDVRCRGLAQQRLPLQARHYERTIRHLDVELDGSSARERRLRRRMEKIETFLDQQIDRAERILKGTTPDRPEPRLRAEGRRRLAQELRRVLADPDEPV
jgi:hypothetical protein